jgi:hypothetical protein
MSFTSRRFMVVSGPMGDQDVVLSTILGSADARALRDALAWQRSTDFLAPSVEHADDVLALLALVALLDQVEEIAGSTHGGPTTLTEPQVAMLAEASTRYVAERDIDAHQPLPERERINRLKALSDPLFDLVAHFVGAREEAPLGPRGCCARRTDAGEPAPAQPNGVTCRGPRSRCGTPP